MTHSRHPTFGKVSKTSNGDIPATSRGDLCKCGEKAVHTVEGKVEVLGRLVPVKIRVCEKHLEIVSGRYSIGETT